MNFVNWFKTKKELIKQIRHLLSENDKLIVDKDKYIKVIEKNNEYLEERDLVEEKYDLLAKELKKQKMINNEILINLKTSKSYKEFKDSFTK